MTFKQINTILDLPTIEEIVKYNINEYGKYNLQYDGLGHCHIIDYIRKLVNNINNKQNFINLFLIESINRLNQNINYYNILIKFLSNNIITSNISNIPNKMLFTNTCTILHYKINNNLYNLYNFVDNNLINEFNTILLNCLLPIYYIIPNSHYIHLDAVFYETKIIKLYLFKYNPDLPINIDLNELKILNNELKIQNNILNIQNNELKKILELIIIVVLLY